MKKFISFMFVTLMVIGFAGNSMAQSSKPLLYIGDMPQEVSYEKDYAAIFAANPPTWDSEVCKKLRSYFVIEDMIVHEAYVNANHEEIEKVWQKMHDDATAMTRAVRTETCHGQFTYYPGSDKPVCAGSSSTSYYYPDLDTPKYKAAKKAYKDSQEAVDKEIESRQKDVEKARGQFEAQFEKNYASIGRHLPFSDQILNGQCTPPMERIEGDHGVHYTWQRPSRDLSKWQ